MGGVRWRAYGVLREIFQVKRGSRWQNPLSRRGKGGIGGRLCRTYAISVTATNTLEISYHPAKSTLPVWGRWKIF